VRGREEPGPGAGTYSTGVADGVGLCRRSNSRLLPPRHYHPVRCTIATRNFARFLITWTAASRPGSTSTWRRPSVPDRCVNSAQLLPGNQPYWMAANNYYIGHARLLTMMALSIDPASRCAMSASFVRTTRDPTSRTTGSWPAANNFRRPVPFATTKGFRPRVLPRRCVSTRFDHEGSRGSRIERQTSRP